MWFTYKSKGKFFIYWFKFDFTTAKIMVVSYFSPHYYYYWWWWWCSVLTMQVRKQEICKPYLFLKIISFWSIVHFFPSYCCLLVPACPILLSVALIFSAWLNHCSLLTVDIFLISILFHKFLFQLHSSCFPLSASQTYHIHFFGFVFVSFWESLFLPRKCWNWFIMLLNFFHGILVFCSILFIPFTIW